MTKTELKMILKLIDIHTCRVSTGCQSYEKQMTEIGIERLKKDIQEVFGKGENK